MGELISTSWTNTYGRALYMEIYTGRYMVWQPQQVCPPPIHAPLVVGSWGHFGVTLGLSVQHRLARRVDLQPAAGSVRNNCCASFSLSFFLSCAVPWPVGVWTVGRSLDFWAHRHITATVNTQLGLDHLLPIQWLEQCGMLWNQLMPSLTDALKSQKKDQMTA